MTCPHTTSRLLASVLILLSLACSSEEDGAQGTGLGPKPANAERSAVCLQWQDASCAYVADKCAISSRAECDDDLQSLFCKSDETMQACITAMASATCPDSPVPCKGVADSAPAKWYCNTFVDLLCARGQACDLGPKAECVKELTASSLKCSVAVGAGPAIETCLSKVSTLPCESLSSGQLPPECQGVIKLLATTSTLVSPAPRPSWSARLAPHLEQVVRLDP